MLAVEHVSGRVARGLVEALNEDETNSLPPAGPATEQGRDVTEWYRKRYRGVVAAERLGGEVLVLFDEGESYGVNRRVLAFADTDQEVLLRSWVDHVPKSRIDPTRPLFGQWAG